MCYNKTMLARSFRKRSTREEIKVWDFLRGKKCFNLKFRRQHVINGFVVDFYCNKLKLAIEIDGKIHEKQKNYDEARQKIIEAHAIIFIRITNEEINNDIELLKNKIKPIIKSPLPSKFPGEGL